MTNFKVGDRVKLKSGKKFPDGEYTRVISEICGVIAHFEGGTLCYIDMIELAYLNPPHKHRDLIIEWANGADIEFFSDSMNAWLYADDPCWGYDTEYRIKPQKAVRDIEIESIQKQMDELKERLEKLKGE